MSYEIYICTGCGKQVLETYEYRHDGHGGEEVLTEVFSAQEIAERLLSNEAHEAALDAQIRMVGRASDRGTEEAIRAALKASGFDKPSGEETNHGSD